MSVSVRHPIVTFLLCVASFFGAWDTEAGAQEYTTTRTVVFFYSNQPPFEYTGQNGLAKGIAINHAHELFKQRGWNVEFAFNSVKRGIENLHAGKYDVSTAVNPTDALRQQFLVSQAALYQITLSAIRKRSTQPIQQVELMRNVAYAAISENTFAYIERWLQAEHPLSQRYDVNDYQQGIRLVELDRLPYFLTYIAPEMVDNRMGLVDDLLLELPVYLIISKQHPFADEIMHTINKAAASDE